jgi:nitric-oxide synthase
MLPTLARARTPGTLLVAAQAQAAPAGGRGGRGGRGGGGGRGSGGGGRGGGGRSGGGSRWGEQDRGGWGQQQQRWDRDNGGSNNAGGGWGRGYNRRDDDDGWQRDCRRRDDDDDNRSSSSSWRRQQDDRLSRQPKTTKTKATEAPAPAAATPVGGSGLGARCYGCGASLQTLLPGAAGFVPQERYDTRRRHRQLDTMLCGRCSDLCNGAMVPAVADFSQRAAAGELGAGGAATATAPATAAATPSPTALHLPVAATLPSAEEDDPSTTSPPSTARPLVDPERLREQLLHVKSRRALVVLLTDLLDASGTLLPRVRDMVGKNPVVLIGTKLDLLPSSTKPRKIAEWLADSAVRRRLTVAATHVISAHTGEGVPQAVARVLKERKGRDVYVIGAANVGKSAFVRAALKEMSRGDGGNFDAAALAHGSRLPVESAMPGTTLGLIALKAFEQGGSLYDTPGVHLHHRVPHLLSPEELKLLHPRRALAPYVVGVGVSAPGAEASAAPSSSPPPSSLVWGGLVRVDVLSAPEDAALAFYGPPAMRVASFSHPSSLPPPLPAALAGSGNGATALAGRAAAVAAALGTTTTASSSPSSGDSSKWLAAADSVAARGGLVAHDVCVPAPPLVAPAPPLPGEPPFGRNSRRRPRREAALADVAISGVPGWIAVHSPRGRRDVQLRVWAPRGVEVFLRPAIPVPPPAALLAGDDDDDDENEAGERRVFSALADALGERTDADGPGEPIEDSEAVRLLLGSVLEASAAPLAKAAAKAAATKGAEEEEQVEEDADPSLAGLDLAALGLEGQEDAVRALLSYGGAFGGGDGDDEDAGGLEEEEEEEEDVVVAAPRRAAAAAPRGRSALAAMRSRRRAQRQQKRGGGGGGD